jgi:hypothetical protein
VDISEQDRERKLVADLLASGLSDRRSKKVIPAGHRFAKKRFDDQFRWNPTTQMENAIVRAIFEKKQK